MHNSINSLRPSGICVSKLTIIGSGNGLSPGRRQVIISTNAEVSLIETYEQTAVKLVKFSVSVCSRFQADSLNCSLWNVRTCLYRKQWHELVAPNKWPWSLMLVSMYILTKIDVKHLRQRVNFATKWTAHTIQVMYGWGYKKAIVT